MSEEKALLNARRLFNACSLGNEGLETVRILKEEGVDLSLCDAHQNNALHYVCQSQKPHAALLEYLFEQGVSPHQKNDEANTPLHVLCYISPSYITSLYTLITAGIDVNSVNQQGMTALHVLYDGRLRLMEKTPRLNKNSMEFYRYSKCNPYLQAVKLLLAHKADPDLANKFGETPLHTAIHKNILRCRIAPLLQNGANPNVRDQDGLTPLHLLCARHNIDSTLIEYMISKGADLYCPNLKKLTPLHFLCQNETLLIDEIKKFFYRQQQYEKEKMKLEVSSESSIFNWFPRVLFGRDRLSQYSVPAIQLREYTFLEREEFLPEKSRYEEPATGDRFSILSKVNFGFFSEKPVHLKSKTDRLNSERINYQKSALSLLLKHQNIDFDTISFLIEKDVDLDITHIQGNTLLHRLCRRKQVDMDMLRLMLQLGDVNPNFQNNRGDTPFHFLMRHHAGDLDLCQLFLTYDADPNAMNKASETPFFLFVQHARTDFKTFEKMILLFSKYGANPQLKTNKGISVLDLLSHCKTSWVIMLFLVTHGIVYSQESLLKLNLPHYLNCLFDLVKRVGHIKEYIEILMQHDPQLEEQSQSYFFRGNEPAQQHFIMLMMSRKEVLEKVSLCIEHGI